MEATVLVLRPGEVRTLASKPDIGRTRPKFWHRGQGQKVEAEANVTRPMPHDAEAKKFLF